MQYELKQQHSLFIHQPPQWVMGLLFFLFPIASSWLRASYLPVHGFCGLGLLVLAIGSSLLGITEKLLFNIMYVHMCVCPVSRYNDMGFSLIVSVSLALYAQVHLLSLHPRGGAGQRLGGPAAVLRGAAGLPDHQGGVPASAQPRGGVSVRSLQDPDRGGFANHAVTLPPSPLIWIPCATNLVIEKSFQK